MLLLLRVNTLGLALGAVEEPPSVPLPRIAVPEFVIQVMHPGRADQARIAAWYDDLRVLLASACWQDEWLLDDADAEGRGSEAQRLGDTRSEKRESLGEMREGERFAGVGGCSGSRERSVDFGEKGIAQILWSLQEEEEELHADVRCVGLRECVSTERRCSKSTELG